MCSNSEGSEMINLAFHKQEKILLLKLNTRNKIISYLGGCVKSFLFIQINASI